MAIFKTGGNFKPNTGHFYIRYKTHLNFGGNFLKRKVCLNVRKIQYVYIHHPHRPNLLSSLKTTDHRSALKLTLSNTRVSVFAGSQWSLVTQQMQNVPGFLPWMLFGCPPLLAQCVELDVHLYNVAIQNLIYGCGNVSQTTAESSNTLSIHCAQHMQQSINMSI